MLFKSWNTYINFGQSSKIMRWKLMIQEFDFSIEHVSGEENVIADAFSRLVEMPRDKEVDLLIHNISSVNGRILNKEYDIIKQFHNTWVGHFGVSATIEKLKP